MKILKSVISALLALSLAFGALPATMDLGSSSGGQVMAAEEEPQAQAQTTPTVDNKPDKVTVNYYVNINDAWEYVGTTNTGYAWNTDNKYMDQHYYPEQGGFARSYITEEQVYSIFGKYGFQMTTDEAFKNGKDSSRELYYQPGTAPNPDAMVYCDTYTDKVNGEYIYPLSQNIDWCVFYTPTNTVDKNVSTLKQIFTQAPETSKFYSIDLWDPQHLSGLTEEELKDCRTVFRKDGENPTVTVPQVTGGWQFVHSNGTVNDQYVNGGEHAEYNNDNKTVKLWVDKLNLAENAQHMYLMPRNTIEKDRVTVTYRVYINGDWQVVGVTQFGIYSNGKAASQAPSDMPRRDRISVDTVASVLGPYGFDKTTASAHNLAYQEQGQTAGQEKAFSDVEFYATETGANGQMFYPLSTPSVSTTNHDWMIYYIPSNTGNLNGTAPAALPQAEFFPVYVEDAQNWIYSPEELTQVNHQLSYYTPGEGAGKGEASRQYYAGAVRKGTSGTSGVKVKRAGWAWKWKDLDGDKITFAPSGRYDTHVVAKPVSGYDVTGSMTLCSEDISWKTDSTAGKQDNDIKTVDRTQLGVTFKLFDYRADINEYLAQKGLMKGPGSQDGNYFCFRDSYSAVSDTAINEKYDRDGFYHYGTLGTDANGNSITKYNNGGPDGATVYRNLQNGMPVLDLTHHGENPYKDQIPDELKNGVSLGGLFSQTTDNTDYVKVYDCVNTPLRYRPDQGHYTYFSNDHAADFDTASGTWYVRGTPERGSVTANAYPDYYDFLPFTNGRTSSGSLTSENPDKNGSYAQSYDYSNEDVDYWFGMSMSINFYQGKGGMAYWKEGAEREENKMPYLPMQFHFAGDDDVWVFVDGMLVMDIGGTHGAVQGSIDFESGLVKVFYDFNGVKLDGQDADGTLTDTRRYSTTVYECYKAAFEEQGLSADEVTDELNKIFVKVEDRVAGNTVSDGWGNVYDVYRFKDYSAHKLDFFYMERGAAASDCGIGFNMPTVPNEALIVGKDLDYTETVDQAYQDFIEETMTYSFRVLDAANKPMFTNQNIPLLSAALEALKDEAGNPITTLSDKDGWFTLKANQRVMFQNMLKQLENMGSDQTAYKVEEKIPDGHTSQYSAVTIKDGAGSSGTVARDVSQTHTTGNLAADVSHTIIYTNTVDTSKFSSLTIGKVVRPGSVWNGTDSFTVRVKLNGSPAANMVFEDVATGAEVPTNANGELTIKNGQVLKLQQPLVAGMTYSVEEVKPSADWRDPTYTLTVNGSTTNYGAGSTQTIAVDQDHTVNISNRTYQFKVEIPVSKRFEGSAAGLHNWTVTFALQQVTDASGKTSASPVLGTFTNVTLTCNGGNVSNGDLVITYNDGTANGTYYYKITETVASNYNKIVVNDANTYVAEISVVNNTATLLGVYQNGQKLAETTAQFVNKAITPQVAPDVAVFDFGLKMPLDVLTNDQNLMPGQAITITGISKTAPSTALNTGIATSPAGFGSTLNLAYGDVTLSGGKLTYTPKTTNVNGVDTFYYEVQVGSYYLYAQVDVLPASNVYFEETFLTQSGWQVDGTGRKPEQSSQNWGYGYDQAYDTFEMNSLGTAYRVTVNDPMTQPTASFTFTGTGFDIISRTTPDSGVMLVEVKQNDKTIKVFLVDTYLENDSLYQLPVVHCDLDYGQYTVVIKAYYNKIFAHTSKGSYDVFIDGVRIYQPLKAEPSNSTASDAYNEAKENGSSYQQIRDILLGADNWSDTNTSGVIYIANGSSASHGEQVYTTGIYLSSSGLLRTETVDGTTYLLDANKNRIKFNGGDVSVDGNKNFYANGVKLTDPQVKSLQLCYYDDKYTSMGPENEAYLKNGQGIAFNVTPGSTVHISAKSPNRKAVTLQIYSGDEWIDVATITSATEMYYDISSYASNGSVIIKCKADDSSAILSVCNIKTCGGSVQSASIDLLYDAKSAIGSK